MWDETVRDAGFQVKKQIALGVTQDQADPCRPLEYCVKLILQQQGVKAVISSSLESSLGLTQLARIAQQYTPKRNASLIRVKFDGLSGVKNWPDRICLCFDLHSEFIVEFTNF